MHIQTSDQESFKLGFGDYSCNWGVHMAGLYENESERDQIIFGLLKQGYIDNDLQLYCPSERSKSDFHEKFSKRCPACDHHLNDPDIFNIISPKELYYPDGTFSPNAMDKGLENFYTKSQRHGLRHIRATAEMSWALDAIPGIEHLMAYESRLNYFIPGKPWISICLYNINIFSGATIMGVLQTHPFTISGGIITQNPYYIPPDNWLAKYDPQFLPPLSDS